MGTKKVIRNLNQIDCTCNRAVDSTSFALIAGIVIFDPRCSETVGPSQITKAGFAQCGPGAFPSQSLQVLSRLKAVAICNSKPAVIRKNWCWPAGQAHCKSKNMPFRCGTRVLASQQTDEASQVTALGNNVCGIRVFTSLLLKESEDWPWLPPGLWTEDRKLREKLGQLHTLHQPYLQHPLLYSLGRKHAES